MPGAAATAAELVVKRTAPPGLQLMAQPQLRPVTDETVRPNTPRPALPPNITYVTFGGAGMHPSRPTTPPIPAETPWGNKNLLSLLHAAFLYDSMLWQEHLLHQPWKWHPSKTKLPQQWAMRVLHGTRY